MSEERTKIHKIARHGENTVNAAGEDISGELAIFSFPDGDFASTECGHLYDPGITSANWDDVSCTICLRKMTK